MDAVPIRKRKAEDDPQPPSLDQDQPSSSAPPRLSLQTAAPTTQPSPWPCSSRSLAIDSDPSLRSPRVKRPRIEPDLAVASVNNNPPAAPDPVAAVPAPTASLQQPPPPPPPSPSPSSSLKSRKRPASVSAARPLPSTPSEALLSDLHTQHGRRWEWRTVQPGETRLVASFRPASHWTRPSDILLSQSEPSSPVASNHHAHHPSSAESVSVIIPIDPSSSHIPPRFPTINRDTLRELDMDSILRNPQLRHDFLFDAGLQFRASSSRRKREQAEAYWRAVDRELDSSCTCVTFDVQGRPQPVCCICRRIPVPPQEPVIACIPVRHRLTLRMPSRLKPLLRELLHVLLSIIDPPAHPSAALAAAVPPRARSQSSSAAPSSAEDRQKHNAEHARALRDALDADLICQEVAHGAFAPEGTFVLIAGILKDHCAPMRDAAIDAMLALARSAGAGSKPDAVRALRACFEILELMKLDIANHQMQSLRPHIVHGAPRFELSVFAERHRAPPALTRFWLARALAALSAEKYALAPTNGNSNGSGAGPTPSPPRAFAALAPRTRVVLAVVRGLADLVFEPPEHYPETLFLDHARLVQLAKDCADLSALYALLLLFRQLAAPPAPLPSSSSSSSSTPPRDYDDETHAHAHAHALRLKSELRELWPPGLGRVFVPACAESPPPAGLHALVLQLAARAAEARRTAYRTPPRPGPPAPAPPQALALAQGWAARHLRLGSPLAARLRATLKRALVDAVARAVVGGVAVEEAAGAGAGVGARDGLEALAPEVKHVAERMARLASLHLGVYRPMYEGEGFVEGL